MPYGADKISAIRDNDLIAGNHTIFRYRILRHNAACGQGGYDVICKPKQKNSDRVLWYPGIREMFAQIEFSKEKNVFSFA